MYFKDSINRPRADEVQPADGVHVHIHSQDALDDGSCCEDLMDRVNTLENAVAQIIDAEDGSDEDPMPDDTEDDEAVVVRRRPVRPLPRENWSDQAAKTSDQEDDDAGSGGAKNRGIPSTPKIDVPESKLPDIGEINARNQAFWAGALTNKNPGPNSAGSLDVEKRLSNTMKQLAPGRTFGITSDQVAQGKAYRAQTARQAKLVAAIEAKNAAFYRRGGR